MSFIYSQALVGEYLADNCSGIDAFAQSNGSPTPNPSWWHDKTMGPSRHSRYGMTYEPLTESHGAELLMWWLEASRAKVSAPLDQELPSTIQKPRFGKSKEESFARWSPHLYTWKTAQLCLFEGLKEFSGTWPRWGSMQGGACFQEPIAERPTNVSACGLWLPTPTAHNAKEGNYPAERTRNTPTLAAVLGGKINPEFTEWMMNWPQGHTSLLPLSKEAMNEWIGKTQGKKKSSTPNSIAGEMPVVRMPGNRSAPPRSQTCTGCDACVSSMSLEAGCRALEKNGSHGGIEALGKPQLQNKVHFLRKGIREKQVAPNGLQQELREQGSARAKSQTPHRTARLKAIGNGQIPVVAAVAWKLLGGP